ncbi:MAG: hypothetical protein BroJett040_13750 [Oligoflexia bacterium]|nr:MAG: hypothetical protein BroJett040_13750 [Oligoflexia bacterium]
MANVFVIILSLVISPVFCLAAGVQAQVSQSGDTLHVEFKGVGQWDYELSKKEEKNKTIVEVTVPRLSEPSVMQFKQMKGPGIEGISVNHNGPDGKDIVYIQLKGSGIDAFDYLTDQPPRLIIDIFSNEKKTAQKSSEKAVKSVVETKESIKAEFEQKADSSKRQPATTDVLVLSQVQSQPQTPLTEPGAKQVGIFDGGDPLYSRFAIADYEIKDDAIIASRNNYYIEFPMLRSENQQLQKILARPPVYEITPKGSEENKQARLLQTLFENKRYNVFLKAEEWFYKKYPNSEYDELIKYMSADIHFTLWREKRSVADFEMAMSRYRQAIEKYPKSALFERTNLLMGYAYLDRGDYLSAIKVFQQYVQTSAASPNRELARLAIAESYLKLNRYDEAKSTYDDIEATGISPQYKANAAYMRGDVYYQKKDFQVAIREYQNAIKKYPENESEFPNAYYNQAGAYFGLQNYRDSLNCYTDFLKKFPSHHYAGYAMTRVGELLEILGADKTRVMGAYLESIFRYGETPSAAIAKLRVLSGRIPTMKSKELEKAVSEAQEISKKSALPKIDQFTTVILADGFTQRKDYDRSIDLLKKYYQENPTNADTELLTKRIVNNINQKISDQVTAGHFIVALKTHNQYADNWLKGSARIDTKYNVARAFEQAGVLSEADTLYRDTLNKLLAIKDTKAGKEKQIFEKLPSYDEMYLRLAAVNLHQKNFTQSYDYLKQIKSPDHLTEAQQIERVQMGAILLEKKGDVDSAIRHLVELIKNWKHQPHLVADPYLYLAELEMKQGKRDDALKSLEKVEQLMIDTEKVSASTHSKALQQLAAGYFEKNQVQKSIEAYEKLLSLYEKTQPISSARYQLGKIYFQKGELQKANETWAKLKDEKNDFWYKLAQEQLNSVQWNGDYKKYIQRIPAMSERK